MKNKSDWYNTPTKEVEKHFHTDIENGLHQKKAEAFLQKYGKNQLAHKKQIGRAHV